MKGKLLFLIGLLLAFTGSLLAQTKVGGMVLDETSTPIPYANVYYKNSSEGVITDENGKFYLESKKLI